MGNSKKAAGWDEGDALAGDAPEEMIASLNSLVRSPPVFWRMYAFHFAVAIVAFAYSILVRNYRIAIIGAGVCIRPIATWVASSDASEERKAAFAETVRILRFAFVGYCIYLVLRSIKG